MSKAPICVKCQVCMRVVKVGVTVVDVLSNVIPPKPRKLWPADVRECPECGIQVTCGYPTKAILQHFEDGFQEHLDRVPEENRVYNYER